MGFFFLLLNNHNSYWVKLSLRLVLVSWALKHAKTSTHMFSANYHSQRICATKKKVCRVIPEDDPEYHSPKCFFGQAQIRTLHSALLCCFYCRSNTRGSTITTNHNPSFGSAHHNLHSVTFDRSMHLGHDGRSNCVVKGIEYYCNTNTTYDHSL